MSLILYFHPLASFCHKVLIALYENQTPFEGRIVDLGKETSRAEFFAIWPVGKIPVLRDESRRRTIPETSIIIEYLNHYYPGPVPLIPQDQELAMQARLWDRFYDLYVNAPMQKIVTDQLRSTDQKDSLGVAEAEKLLVTAYEMIEEQMGYNKWAVGDQFTIADCAAAPALFYAGIVESFSNYKKVADYFDRLASRASVVRVIKEARPYFELFPFRDAIPSRFLTP